MVPVPGHAPSAAVRQQPASTLPFEMRELNEAENAALPAGRRAWRRRHDARRVTACWWRSRRAAEDAGSAWSVSVEDMRGERGEGPGRTGAGCGEVPGHDLRRGGREQCDGRGAREESPSSRPREAAAIVAWRDAGHALATIHRRQEGAGARRQAPRRRQAAAGLHRKMRASARSTGGSTRSVTRRCTRTSGACSHRAFRSVRTTLPTGLPSSVTIARIW